MYRSKTLVIKLMVVAVLAIPAGAGEPTPKPAKIPNLLIDVSAAVVHAVVQRAADKTQPVAEVIQDTPVRGLSRTLGNVWAELVPDSHHAAVDIVLRGQVLSKSIGTRPHVLIHTCTTTELDVRHRIMVNEKEIRLLPCAANAQASTTLLDVTSRAEPDALAVWIAERGFQRAKQAGEAEASFKTARHASNALSEEISPALAAASKTMGRGIKEMKRIGLSLESLTFNTTADFLQTRARIAAPGRTEPNHLPPLPQDFDIGLRLHESFMNESAQALHGGRAFPLTETSKLYDEVTFGLLRDGRKGDDKKDGLKKLEKALVDSGVKRSEAVLAKKAPLTVAFTDQGFTFEIHIASVRQEDKTLVGMRVKATYRLENTKEGVHFVRVAPVRFSPSEEADPFGKKFEPQPATFLLIREVLFDEILKERFTVADLPLPDSLSRLRLRAPRAGARDGWFALAWQLASNEPRP